MRACDRCLGRSLLLQDLAARLDRAVDRRAGERARDVLALSDRELAEALGADGPGALAACRDPARLAGLRSELEGLGAWSVCRHEPGWPADLEALGDSAPRALIGRGRRELLAAVAVTPAVTIVGSRRASPYGREVASELAAALSSAGVPVVSGMAFGIDTAAHDGALAGGGLTLAVLGTGPDRAYPRARARLYERVLLGGAVVSELPPRSATFRWMFPARNRLMAAIARLTIVVEAAERSGSLITAEMAIDLGRQVGAVPGPVTATQSRGANRLLAEGATVVRDAQDALDALLGPGTIVARSAGPDLAGLERPVLEAIEAGASTADAISSSLGIGAGEAAAALASLELSDYVRSDLAGRYRRTALEAGGQRVG